VGATPSDDAPLTRTERRWIATHDELVAATLDELLGPTPQNISATSIATRADRAAGTFFNHFDSVESAVTEAMQPVVDLRDAVLDLFNTAEDPATIVPLVLGSVMGAVASVNRELLAARANGYRLPGTGPLSEAVIAALGGEDSPNHLAYTTRLVASTIDQAVIAFSHFEVPPTAQDIRRLGWNLMTTACPPCENIEKIVEEATMIALDQLGIDSIS
jgi:AcrR family transcriptional regulator